LLKPTQRVAEAVADVDARDAARPVVEVRAADAELVAGLEPVPLRQRFVVVVAHPAAHVHDELRLKMCVQFIAVLYVSFVPVPPKPPFTGPP
jgi:hypothetical protein